MHPQLTKYRPQTAVRLLNDAKKQKNVFWSNTNLPQLDADINPTNAGVQVKQQTIQTYTSCLES